LSEPVFRELITDLAGYDLDLCGKMVFPHDTTEEKEA